MLFAFFLTENQLIGQNVFSGKILDASDGEPLIGANIVVKGTTDGNVTDYDGIFEVSTSQDFPLTIVASYLGYDDVEQIVNNGDDKVTILMKESSVTIDVVEVKASRLSEETKKSPLTIESLDLQAVKETSSSNFYEGLGQLKGVDLTTASLGFQVINTRGFNSTSPVRSLQIIDGVDNQAPGLNFSLGNFLGSSELDIMKVDLIVGASSAFYGPNAFNGVISMETKDPFFHKGLSSSIKFGERNLIEGAVRYADAFKNKDGNEWFGYKLNLAVMQADDWVADNDDPVFETISDRNNPGRYDQVNTYGDEYSSRFDRRGENPWSDLAGAKVFHRNGYDEIDVVDYDSENLKTNVAFHFKTAPSKGFESPELIAASSYSTGTTVYQGDNRYSLRNIQFFQQRLEFKKKDKYFFRTYMTVDDAGDTYDPYFTSLLLQEQSKTAADWASDYNNYWRRNINDRMLENGYPQLTFDPVTGLFGFDQEAADAWFMDPDNQALLEQGHEESLAFANTGRPEQNSVDFFEPGTDRFNERFQEIISRPSGDPKGGTRLIDRSALYHAHGEYKFEPKFADYLKVGANARLYTPESEGTVFYDTAGVNINTFEYGVYAGLQKSVMSQKLKLSGTIRMDKNQNFDYLFSPAVSAVWTVADQNFLRLSFSSAVRNPTLTDQYLDFNVGRATLRGNLDGVEDLITVESFGEFRNSLDPSLIERFDIDPIRPEQVQTIELGYRTTLFDRLFFDGGYYFSRYEDFIGFNIGIDAFIDPMSGFPSNIEVFRYSANSQNTVTTQGMSVGLNYYVDNYKIVGNYSWNRLNSDIDDPIIPAFNTPEHKYNIGFSGRDLFKDSPEDGGLGFNVNYKWVEGYLFEGSPQFTGFIPSYGLVDVQVNYNFPKWNTTVKVGASNVLDNQVFQTYGGPRVGRLGYIKFTYDWKKD